MTSLSIRTGTGSNTHFICSSTVRWPTTGSSTSSRPSVRRRYAPGLIHKEWPETLPGRDADRRGLFDLAVLAPSQLAQASIDQFRQGRIHAPIVVEVGLDYGRAHLEQDLEKLRNSEVPYAYVVHFSRLPAGGKVEDLLTAAYPNIRTAYAHVPPTGGRAVKHLTDTDIIRSE
jgi:hypothetical protein